MLAMIPRLLEQTVRKQLFGGMAIVIYGARQVGKTTLVKNILADYENDGIYLNCDQPDIASALANKTSLELYEYVQRKKLVIFDEAQRVENIGITIKLLIDSYPEIQIIATGSSSFELANKISEPLTGRAWFHKLYPLSYEEIANGDKIAAGRSLTRMLRLGTFPKMWEKDESTAIALLNGLTTSFLFKDLLQFEQLRQAPLLTKLLQALALQLGNEVSYAELAKLLSVDAKTVERYIFLLEQVFIIFRLPTLKRKPRTEVSRLRKVYFYDLGVRNSLIQNFNDLSLRTDTGALWENFCIVERLKHNDYHQKFANYFFWRSYDKQEVDFIEESGGNLTSFEFKWQKPDKLMRAPSGFTNLYPDSEYSVVDKENFEQFISKDY
jgi:predicted AAA+ superfamily ATPase